MPSIKDSAFGGFLFWPQLDAEARRELKALPTSKETPTEEEVLLDRYANQMCQRGVLGQVLVIMSPVFFALLGLTQHPNFGWAALVALFGGLATFLKAAWDIAKQDDPDFKPPRDTVRTWDMNDPLQAAWVAIVVGVPALLGLAVYLLGKVLWFLFPLLPKKWQESSDVYGDALDPEMEKIRALFAGISFVATGVCLVLATRYGIQKCWIGVGVAGGIFMVLTVMQRSAITESHEASRWR